MESVQQRSLEWREQRLGKFTASEIYKLMANGSRKMTDEELASYKLEFPKGKKTTIETIGETFKSYAFEKAIEELYGEVDDNFTSYDMERGTELEPLAFAKFKELKSLEFVDVEACSFFNYGENAGASPDGLVGDDAILEIKCPKNSTFFKLVATGEIDQKYLYQMQLQMMATRRTKAYFFNYTIIDGQEFWHTIEVERDGVIVHRIKERIEDATEIKNEYINKLKTNQQWK